MNLTAWRQRPVFMDSEEAREQLIRGVKERLIAASESGQPEQYRRDLFNAMRALMRGRSKAQVARLEKARANRA